MHYITRSRTAMTLAVLAAGLFVLGALMGLIAFATLNISNPGSFTSLGHAHDWLTFSAALVALVGVSAAAWELVLAKRNAEVPEVAGAAVATLFIAIGSLVNASSSSGSQTANVLGAIGVGGWGALCLIRAARRSLAEQHGAVDSTRQASIWLTAAVGLFVLAIGSGLVTSIDNQGVSVAAGVIQTLGILILAASLAIARNQRFLISRPMPAVLAGLGLVAASFLTQAITAGVVYGPGGTISGLRVGLSIAYALQMLGAAALGYAAWLRTAELITSGTKALWASGSSTLWRPVGSAPAGSGTAAAGPGVGDPTATGPVAPAPGSTRPAPDPAGPVAADPTVQAPGSDPAGPVPPQP